MAPYALGRIVTVIITALVWWVILLVTTLVFAGASQAQFVSPRAMTNIAALTLLLVPFFTTHGVLINFRDAMLRGRVRPPETTPSNELRARSPWRVALVSSLLLGSPAAVAAYLLGSRLPNATFTAGAFALRLAPIAALLGGVSAWFASGKPLVHELRVAEPHQRFAGDVSSYAVFRHALPHGVVNALINGAAAFALLPDAQSAAGNVPAKLLLGDTFITYCILTAILAPGVSTHARVDAATGVAPPMAAGSRLTMSEAVMLPLGVGLLQVALLAPLCWLSAFRPSVELWAVYRAVMFGGYAAWLSARVARAARTQAAETTQAAATTTI
jgi:hypothetical protein